jgi:hypothetical protein
MDTVVSGTASTKPHALALAKARESQRRQFYHMNSHGGTHIQLHHMQCADASVLVLVVITTKEAEWTSRWNEYLLCSVDA